MLSDIGVPNVDSFFNVHTFYKLSGVAAGCNSRTATESLEHSLLDSLAIFLYFDLEFHNIATSWSSY